jgi:hypothetical protein
MKVFQSQNEHTLKLLDPSVKEKIDFKDVPQTAMDDKFIQRSTWRHMVACGRLCVITDRDHGSDKGL